MMDIATATFDNTVIAEGKSVAIMEKEQYGHVIAKTYSAQIKKCDETADYDLEFGDLSTSGMDASVDKQISCYKAIAHQIIDKYYSKQSEKMKQVLEEYIKLSYQVSMNSYWPDNCRPSCGTITTSMAYNYALQDVKRYLDNLIYALRMF
jgi:hypothetical protein